jgi:hypothetical protein
MFDLYDRVRIVDKGVIGEIIDIYRGRDGNVYYTVEDLTEGPSSDPDAFNLRFPQYECTAEQLERI